MANNKKLIQHHAKKYIEDVFESRLREEGFSCPNDRYLCWYRVNGGEIVNALVFFSCWSNIPVMLEIGYGIHPLFQRPAYTTNVNYPKRPIDNELFREQPLVEDVPIGAMGYIRYAEDIQVMAPGHGGKGIYTFDGIILPQMDSVHTIEECYLLHKQNLLNSAYDDLAAKFSGLSSVFIDEAIYVDDAEVYPFCKQQVTKMIALFQKQCANYPSNKDYLIALHSWEQRRAALFDGSREEYLSILGNRKNENTKYLKTKLGITF